MPIDAKLAHRQAAERETNPLARYVLDKLVDNADLAVLEQRPVCGDTVREVSFHDKSFQYCPTCQTDGRELADRRLSKLIK